MIKPQAFLLLSHRPTEHKVVSQGWNGRHQLNRIELTSWPVCEPTFPWHRFRLVVIFLLWLIIHRANCDVVGVVSDSLPPQPFRFREWQSILIWRCCSSPSSYFILAVN